MFVTALFHTETVAGSLPPGARLTPSGRLHDIGSGVAILAIAVAAAMSSWLAGRRGWFAVVSAWALGLAIVSDATLLALGSSVGGIRERILITIGCVWQACLLRSASMTTIIAPAEPPELARADGPAFTRSTPRP